jgi:ribosomal protein S18 acetylase RimI-like enzyme
LTTIRTPDASEADTLAALHVITWQEAYEGLLPEAYLASLAPTQRLPMWQRLLTPPSHASVFVAEIDDEVIGFACGGASSDDDADETIGEMWMIYLRRACWGSQIGRGLHDVVLADLRRRGFQEATLWVMATNARTRGWYERRGWALDARQRSVEVWGTKVAEVRYRRRLGAARVVP